MSKILKRLLIVTIALFIVFTHPYTVHATSEGPVGGNGDSDDGGLGSRKIINGPSAAKQFWLVYITDESGAVQTDVADVVMLKSGDMSCTSSYVATRPEHGSITPSTIIEGSDFGWSFDSQGRGRGTEIKNYLKEKDESGQPRAATLISKLWGTQTAEDWVSNQWYLVLENGLWCNIYINGVNQNTSFAGTAYGWGYLQSLLGEGMEKGDPLINRYTNNILPNSSKLQFSQTGLAKPTSSGKISNDLMKTEGYGCLIIWAGNEGQTTCDIFIIII